MRYFAQMYDGSIKTAIDVSRGFNRSLYFTVDETKYQYDPQRTHLITTRDIITSSWTKFRKFIDNDWYLTREVEYFYSLDETEDEELNYFQSTDFNAGVIYTYVEKIAVNMINNKDKQMVVSEIVIPAIQLIPKGLSICDEAKVKAATSQIVLEHFNAVYGKSFSLTITHFEQEKQYFKIHFTVKRKEEYKEMTVAEIEEALGYKIKIVK